MTNKKINVNPSFSSKEREKEKERLKKQLINFKIVHDELLDDLLKLNNLLIENPGNNCYRRAFVRSLYSHIEAVCYIWKKTALISDNIDILLGKVKKRRLSREEIALINEESYYLTNSGEAKIRDSYVEATKNFKFAFKVYSRVTGKNLKLNYSEEGWRCYKEGIKIRNRLTHPKTMSDLYISEKDEKLLNEVIDWFYGTLILLNIKKDSRQKKIKIQ